MKNLLFLHEAIIVVLMDTPNRTATFNEIANKISERKLYYKKNGDMPDANQIRMRTTLANGQYHHIFELIEPDMVRLRNYNYNKI